VNRRMKGCEGEPLRRGGWVLFLPENYSRLPEERRRALLASAFAAIDGTLPKSVRRSRHAETWLERLGEGARPFVYIKVLDAARGLRAIRMFFTGSRVAHVARISERLRRDGIGVPEILLVGAEERGGREIIATASVRGFSVLRHVSTRSESLAAKRAVLRGLGAEVARLHHAGYLHGDLTPYNIFVRRDDPSKFVFIDHDRTRRTIMSRFERPRMRNLVQLGHIDFKTITNTDRMRVWCAYSAAMPVRRRRATRRRAAAMLRRRIARDRNFAQAAETVVPERTEVREG